LKILSGREGRPPLLLRKVDLLWGSRKQLELHGGRLRKLPSSRSTLARGGDVF